jgi:hypothetical protein
MLTALLLVIVTWIRGKREGREEEGDIIWLCRIEVTGERGVEGKKWMRE